MVERTVANLRGGPLDGQRFSVEDPSQPITGLAGMVQPEHGTEASLDSYVNSNEEAPAPEFEFWGHEIVGSFFFDYKEANG